MRKSFLTLIALATLPLAAFAMAPQTVTLDVQNMTCPVCPITVKKSLQSVSGVSDVSIDFAKKTARVTYDPDKAKSADLTAATANAGYPSTVQK
ncbi:MAG: mercury resistance system periplasmic binding protein MerP [Acidobacteriaceae bacterium]